MVSPDWLLILFLKLSIPAIIASNVSPNIGAPFGRASMTPCTATWMTQHLTPLVCAAATTANRLQSRRCVTWSRNHASAFWLLSPNESLILVAVAA